MTEGKIIKRQIKLKKQAKDLIETEIFELHIRYDLVRWRRRLEEGIGDFFDPLLSRKLDCINFLLENLN